LTYKSIKEDTSSSLSSRHVGHYKAILSDPSLINVHTTMVSIPFQHGFVPQRWTRVADVMLQKDKGSARCHRLRIIALFESNLNQAKRILIGQKLNHHLEDENLLSNIQFGSWPGIQCQSAVLHKVLAHDKSRLSKCTSAYIENNAVGCYDRMVNNLLLRWLGFAISISSCLGA
jgi:hypothetical protein